LSRRSVDPVGGQAEALGVDGVVVLAQAATGESDRAGGGLHAEHQVLHLQRPEVFVVDGGDRLAGLHVRVAHQLCDVVDRSQRCADPFEFRAHRVQGSRGDPFRHRSSSRSPLRARSPAEQNHGSSTRSGRPTRRMTRSATDVALAEIATQRPSLVR
jgi:hypothetical protein